MHDLYFSICIVIAVLSVSSGTCGRHIGASALESSLTLNKLEHIETIIIITVMITCQAWLSTHYFSIALFLLHGLWLQISRLGIKMLTHDWGTHDNGFYVLQ